MSDVEHFACGDRVEVRLPVSLHETTGRISLIDGDRLVVNVDVENDPNGFPCSVHAMDIIRKLS